MRYTKIIFTCLLMLALLSSCKEKHVEIPLDSNEPKSEAKSTETQDEPEINESANNEANNTSDLTNVKIIDVTKILKEFVNKETLNKSNPWLIAQGIKALGTDRKMESGKNTVEFLFQFLEQVTIKGKKYLKFRTGDYYDNLADANPNMILKILIDQNVDQNKGFETEFGAVSLKMLMHNAMMLLRPDHLDNAQYPNLDWTIEVLVDYVDPENPRWVNAYDQVVDLKKMIEKNFDIFKNHMKSIRQHYKNNLRRISKLSSIHSDIDGGSHMFWSTAKAIEKGFGTPEMLEDLREQAELIFYRLKFEPFAYEAMHPDAKNMDIPESERRIKQWAYYRDLLKFYAYQLESAQIIQKNHFITIDEPRQKILDKAYENLNSIILLMYTGEVFKWIHQWNKKPENPKSLKHIVYHDIVADSCQALRVLNNK